jgi:hypothetical protein
MEEEKRTGAAGGAPAEEVGRMPNAQTLRLKLRLASMKNTDKRYEEALADYVEVAGGFLKIGDLPVVEQVTERAEIIKKALNAGQEVPPLVPDLPEAPKNTRPGIYKPAYAPDASNPESTALFVKEIVGSIYLNQLGVKTKYTIEQAKEALSNVFFKQWKGGNPYYDPDFTKWLIGELERKYKECQESETPFKPSPRKSAFRELLTDARFLVLKLEKGLTVGGAKRFYRRKSRTSSAKQTKKSKRRSKHKKRN